MCAKALQPPLDLGAVVSRGGNKLLNLVGWGLWVGAESTSPTCSLPTCTTCAPEEPCARPLLHLGGPEHPHNSRHHNEHHAPRACRAPLPGRRGQEHLRHGVVPHTGASWGLARMPSASCWASAPPYPHARSRLPCAALTHWQSARPPAHAMCVCQNSASPLAHAPQSFHQSPCLTGRTASASRCPRACLPP